jgi:hypothetical protein
MKVKHTGLDKKTDNIQNAFNRGILLLTVSIDPRNLLAGSNCRYIP